MALINRVSRLFKADFNAVLDHIEEPEQLLRQAIRDMEDELAASEQHIALCTQEQEALGARRAEMLASAGEFGQQLDLCFESGKEELARGIEKLNDENRATLDGLRQKAELIVSRTPAERDVGGREDIARIACELRVDDDEVEIAFLREKAARSRS
jgi:phage shock protein A